MYSGIFLGAFLSLVCCQDHFGSSNLYFGITCFALVQLLSSDITLGAKHSPRQVAVFLSQWLCCSDSKGEIIGQRFVLMIEF